MYIVSRKNGSFPGGKRTLRFFTYDEMRAYLRSYFRSVFKWPYPRSTHPSMGFITRMLAINIKKEV